MGSLEPDNLNIGKRVGPPPWVLCLLSTPTSIDLEHVLKAPMFLVATNHCRYFMPVYPSASGGKMEYEEHRRHTRSALNSVDCVAKKSTHLPRQAGADRVIDGG